MSIAPGQTVDAASILAIQATANSAVQSAGGTLNGGTLVGGTADGVVILHGSANVVPQTAPFIFNGNTAAGAASALPAGTLQHLQGADGQVARSLVETWGPASGRFTARTAAGTKAAPVATNLNKGLVELSTLLYDGTVYSGVVAEVFIYANPVPPGPNSGTDHGAAIALNVVPPGTTTLVPGAVVVGDGPSGIMMFGTLAQAGTSTPAWIGGPRIQVIDQLGLLASQVNVGVDNTAPNWTSGSGAPLSTQPKGSGYMRKDGGVGTTVYVSQGGGVWNAIPGV